MNNRSELNVQEKQASHEAPIKPKQYIVEVERGGSEAEERILHADSRRLQTAFTLLNAITWVASLHRHPTAKRDEQIDYKSMRDVVRGLGEIGERLGLNVSPEAEEAFLQKRAAEIVELVHAGAVADTSDTREPDRVIEETEKESWEQFQSGQDVASILVSGERDTAIRKLGIDILCHQLNSKLTVLNGLSATLKKALKKGDSASQNSLQERVRAEQQALYTTSLLAPELLSKLYLHEDLSGQSVYGRLLGGFRSAAETSNVALSNDTTAEEQLSAVRVEWDRRWIAVLADNFIQNTSRARSENVDPRVSLRVRVIQKDGRPLVRIEYRDNGRGFPEAMLAWRPAGDGTIKQVGFSQGIHGYESPASNAQSTGTFSKGFEDMIREFGGSYLLGTNPGQEFNKDGQVVHTRGASIIIDFPARYTQKTIFDLSPTSSNTSHRKE